MNRTSHILRRSTTASCSPGHVTSPRLRNGAVVGSSFSARSFTSVAGPRPRMTSPQEKDAAAGENQTCCCAHSSSAYNSCGQALFRGTPVRLQAAAAASSQPAHDKETIQAASNSTASLETLREMIFFDSFLESEVDVHYQMLYEAYIKHGVNLNVPPQLPPKGESPEVPELLLPKATKDRLSGLAVAYAATHGPPPLSTTGSRGLEILREDDGARGLYGTSPPSLASFRSRVDSEEKQTQRSTTTPVRSTTPPGQAGAFTSAIPRRPVEPDMKFHCNSCGKPFRNRISAEQHVALRHKAAAVVDGPGPGEIDEDADTLQAQRRAPPTTPSVAGVAQTSSAVPATATLDSQTSPVEKTASVRQEAKTSPAAELSSETSPASASAPSPKPAGSRLSNVLSDELQKEKAYMAPTLEIPTDDTIDSLLGTVWDVVGPDVCGKNYLSYGSVVEGVADRRQEIADAMAAAGIDGKTLARATPEGAAPGIKRTGLRAVASRSTRLLPIRELVKNYPNPFGDSAGGLGALQAEIENEPENPFTAADEDTIFMAVTGMTLTEAVERLKNTNGKEKAKPGSLEPDAVVAPAAPEAVTEAAAKKVESGTKAAEVYVRAGTPTLKRAAESRRFTCPRCFERHQNASHGTGTSSAMSEDVPSFRILDALMDHMEEMHADEDELSEEELRTLRGRASEEATLYMTKRNAQDMAKHMTSQVKASGGASAAHSTTAGNSSGSGVGGGSASAGGGTGSDSGNGSLLPPPLNAHDVHVHISSFSNVILVGTVVDVQRGYLGTAQVTQYVLRVVEEKQKQKEASKANTEKDSDSVDNMQSQSTAGKEEQSKEEEGEEELITVRCVGGNFPVTLFKDQIKIGTMLYVQGVLRMNRHLDDESKRVHAYPFVQVTFPLGSIQVLDR